MSSGGLGTDVNAILRAASLPGVEHVLAIAAHRHLIATGRAIGRLAATVGIRPKPGVLESARAFVTLADSDIRDSFVHTLRGIIDHRGQRVTATDRLYLMNDIPCLLIWGDHDRIIPVDHGRLAHRAMAASQLEIFEGSGHFPHVDDPDRFARTVHEFIDTTTPASQSRRRLDLLRPASAHPRRRHAVRELTPGGTPVVNRRGAINPHHRRSTADLVRNCLGAASPGLEAGAQDVHCSRANIPAKSLLRIEGSGRNVSTSTSHVITSRSRRSRQLRIGRPQRRSTPRRTRRASCRQADR